MREGTPSATARVIAAATVFSHDGEVGIVPRLAAEWSVRFLQVRRADRFLLAGVRNPLLGWALRALDRAVLPGAVRHWAVRKQWIEKAWVEATEFTQLVVVGGGPGYAGSASRRVAY